MAIVRSLVVELTRLCLRLIHIFHPEHVFDVLKCFERFAAMSNCSIFLLRILFCAYLHSQICQLAYTLQCTLRCLSMADLLYLF